jgi:hypothetical protein
MIISICFYEDITEKHQMIIIDYDKNIIKFLKNDNRLR